MSITLEPEPTFVAKVGIKKPSGEVVDVPLRFKWRTRDEFIAWSKTCEGMKDIDVVMECVTGWELADEFSRVNVEKLLQKYATAGFSISVAYGRALTEARLGN